MIKVGNVKEYIKKKDKKTGKLKKTEVLYSYKDIHYDIDGWADVSKAMPEDYDLVYMKIDSRKTISGWVSGHTWQGLRLKKEGKVLYWKRKPEEKDQ